VSELPSGWVWTTLGVISETRLGKMLSAKARSGVGSRPYLRNKNVQWGRIDLDDVLAMDFSEGELDRFRVLPGDLLICEGGEVGRAAIWRGQIDWIGYQKALHRVRPQGGIAPEYLLYGFMWLAQTNAFEPHVTGSTIKHLPQEDLRLLRMPLPPLNEQRRIVAAIEEQLSRLDAADASLAAALRRLAVQRRAVLFAALDQAGPPKVSASELLSVSIGGVWGKEPGADEVDVSVFRVTEFRADGLLDPSTAACRSITHKQLASRELLPDDLLIEKSGGGPDRPVGRVALVPIHQGHAVCSNFVQLIRADPARIHPRFLFRWLQRRYLDGSATAHQTASTNIRNLKTPNYLNLLIPVPPLDEQRRIVAEVEERLSVIDAMRLAIERAERRSATLRRSILERAFRGELVPQDLSDEPASVLLDRIRAERKIADATPRRRRVKA